MIILKYVIFFSFYDYFCPSSSPCFFKGQNSDIFIKNSRKFRVLKMTLRMFKEKLIAQKFINYLKNIEIFAFVAISSYKMEMERVFL